MASVDDFTGEAVGGGGEPLLAEDDGATFERGSPPAPELAAREVAARAELSRLADVELEELPNWRSASAGELEHAFRLARTATVDDGSFEAELARGRETLEPITEAAQRALTSLRTELGSGVKVRWYGVMGSPARLDSVGFVRRGVPPEDVVNAFRASYAPHLSTLFGEEGRCAATLADVVSDGTADMDVLRYRRVCDGVAVPGQWLRFHVSTASSRIGDGVLWNVRARWDRELGRKLPAADASAWLDLSHARRLAGAESDAPANRSWACSRTRCVPMVEVLVRSDLVVALDALTGAELSRSDPTLHGGPIFLGTYRPGTTALTPARFRGAAIYDNDSVHRGYASLSDGTYGTLAGPRPMWVGHEGGRPSGTWPTGRVDRRSSTNWTGGTIPIQMPWYPETNPSQDFSSYWFPQPQTLQRSSMVLYAWLSYWQEIMKTQVQTQVTDTLSYSLAITMLGRGVGGCSTKVVGALPGSGQETWGQISCGVGDLDDMQLSNPTDDLSLVAHEFGHTVVGCAATAGASCDNRDPGNVPHDPYPLSEWRRNVWGASVENLPNLVSAILSEFRDAGEGGYSTWSCGTYACPPGFSYRPDWVYGGYSSLADLFGTCTEDSLSALDCANPSTPCPMGYTCVQPTNENPLNLNRGVCARTCTGPCSNPGHWCAGAGFCWNDDYTNAWFSTAGSRLALDAGWKATLRNYLFATDGNDLNWSRDFNVGDDTWYQGLLDANLFTRYEVTRALASVTTESGFDFADDFTSDASYAIPMTVIDATGTPIWWGNGASLYPNFEDIFDVDYVLMRGLGGTTYEVTASPVGGSAADIHVSVYRWRDGFSSVASGSAPSGPSVAQQFYASTTDWYVVAFTPRTTASGAWEGRIKVVFSDSMDEFAGSTSEAYPMPSGIAQAGHLRAYDRDYFQIYVPTSGTSLSITAPASPSAARVTVYQPNGNVYGSGTGGYAIVSVPTAGYWTWAVENTAATVKTYTTSATIGCASGSTPCDDRTYASSLSIRNSWGDRLAGRLPFGTSTAKYAVTLGAQQHVGVSLAHNSTNACRLQLDVSGPSTAAYFGGNRIFRYTDDVTVPGGAAANDPGGFRNGPGGHFVASIPGTYTLRVSSRNGVGNCHYRLFVAKSDLVGEGMPSW